MATRYDWQDEVEALRADTARTAEDIASLRADIARTAEDIASMRANFTRTLEEIAVTREEIARISRQVEESAATLDYMRRSQAASIFGELAGQALCFLCTRAGIRSLNAHTSPIDLTHEELLDAAFRHGLRLQELVDLRAKARAVTGTSSTAGFFWHDVERRITAEWEPERALIEQLVRLRLRCPHVNGDYDDSDGEGEGDADDEGVALESVVW